MCILVARKGCAEMGRCRDSADQFKARVALPVDLLRFDAAPLIAFIAAKETGNGTETD